MDDSMDNSLDDSQDPGLLATGYALGSLSPEEVAAYEAYLAGTADARQDAEAYQRTAAALGLGSDPVTPRPEL